MPLPLRLRTREGEPPHGALSRLAARHREPDVRAFAATVGCSHRSVLLGRQAGLVAALAGIDPAMLSRHAAVVDVPRRLVTLVGEHLLLNDWSTGRRRWCPACFVEDRIASAACGEPAYAACWHRSCWDVRSVDSCAAHRIRLSDACRSCGTAQGWLGPALDMCRCGANLAAARNEALAGAEGGASAYASGRLGFSSAATIPLVDGLALKDALTIFERLGECALLGHRLQKTQGAMPGPGRARDGGVLVARSWPSSFVAVLDAVVSEGRSKGVGSGLIAAYGWIYSEWVTGHLPSSLADQVRGTLAEHAVHNGVVPCSEPLFGTASPRPATTLTAAARTLGLGFGRARRILNTEGLMHPAVRRGVAAPLAADDVLAIRARLDGEVGIIEVGRRLGTSRTQVRAIVGAGLLAPACGTAARRFPIAGVDELSARLEAGAPASAAPPSGASPLPRACKAKGVFLAIACGAILAGRLKVVWVDAGSAGLPRLLVRPGDVGRLRLDRGMTMEAASAALGIHGDATRYLVRRGVLRTMAGRGTINVDEASVRHFGKRYVPAAEIAMSVRRSPKATVAMLETAGVTKAFGPPECRQAFFVRVDAARFVASLTKGDGVAKQPPIGHGGPDA